MLVAFRWIGISESARRLFLDKCGVRRELRSQGNFFRYIQFQIR